MKTAFAKRPKFSDVEREDGNYDFACKTCWQTVTQPFIKGIWFHDYNFKEDPYGCQNLIPVRHSSIDQDARWTCDHEYRLTPDMTEAVKCVKCGHPLRIDMFDFEDSRKDYFCITCDKPFKILKQHFQKVHKKKGFEFRLEVKKIG